MAKIISIASTKGGVGKTFVSVNLAAALKKFLNKEVLVIDANISAPNLAINVGIVNPSISIQDVIDNKIEIEHAIEKTRYFDLVAARIGQEEVKNKKFDLAKAIDSIKDIYDFIIIDTSPNMNWETKMAINAADEVIFVSNPDFFSISNLANMINKLKKDNMNKLKGIVLNRVLGKRFEIQKEEIEEITKLPVLEKIPFSISVLESLAFTEPVVYYKPYSRASRACRSLAEKISGEKARITLVDKILEFIFG